MAFFKKINVILKEYINITICYEKMKTLPLHLTFTYAVANLFYQVNVFIEHSELLIVLKH